MAIFVLGGTRSGKSQRAQHIAEQRASNRIYVATAQALDDEMSDRIAKHQNERGSGWQTVEAPLNLAEALAEHDGFDGAILVDCLTLWLSNLMHHEFDIETSTEHLIEQMRSMRTPLILVSNEIGLGLVPETKLGRQFRDAQGQLNQRVAAAADTVEFVAAGLPITLKGKSI